MPPKAIELTAKILEERYRFPGDAVVLECVAEDGNVFRAKGRLAPEEYTVGCWYRLYGRFKRHYRHGSQFVFDTLIASRPLDEEGIVAYLRRAPGIGAITARRLFKLYRDRAVEQLRQFPEATVEELQQRGFGVEAARRAAAFLESEAATEKAEIELMSLFLGSGFPKRLVKDVISKYGNAGVDLIRSEPYRLLSFRGCGFLKVDALYLQLGHDAASIERQKWSLWYSCCEGRDGSTWEHSGDCLRDLRERVGATRILPIEAAREAMASELIVKRRDESGALWFSEFWKAKAEYGLAQAVAEFRYHGAPSWPRAEDLDVSDHQSTELAKALEGRLGVFCGSPGTGKTYTAARLVKEIVRQHGRDSVIVLAPTGKARVRINQSLQDASVFVETNTIHGGLQVASDDGGGGGSFTFVRNSNNPLPYRFVIVDESSMADTWLLYRLLDACGFDSHVLLVGDVNQLAPVGSGAPLRDFMNCDLVPKGEITEIRRNSGRIVETCAVIRDGKPWRADGLENVSAENNLVLLDVGKGGELEALRTTVESQVNTDRTDAVWGCQVIVALNESGDLARKKVNEVLQRDLNAKNRIEDRFWPNDKVVCLENSWLPACGDLMADAEGTDIKSTIWRSNPDTEQDEIRVSNGELGKLLVVEPNRLIVVFHDPTRIVLVPRGESGKVPIDLGYALSCHKAQGSEWPFVIVMLDSSGGARMVSDRSWIYTAISRARKRCLLIGRQATADQMTKRTKIADRKTFLVEQIGEAYEFLKTKGGDDAATVGREQAPAAETE